MICQYKIYPILIQQIYSRLQTCPESLNAYLKAIGRSRKCVWIWPFQWVRVAMWIVVIGLGSSNQTTISLPDVMSSLQSKCLVMALCCPRLCPASIIEGGSKFFMFYWVTGIRWDMLDLEYYDWSPLSILPVYLVSHPMSLSPQVQKYKLNDNLTRTGNLSVLISWLGGLV